MVCLLTWGPCASCPPVQHDWAARFSDDEKEGHRQKTKLKRIVTVEDVAEQVFTFVKTKGMTGVKYVIILIFLLRSFLSPLIAIPAMQEARAVRSTWLELADEMCCSVVMDAGYTL